MTWSISIALFTTKVVRSLTYTPLSTFSFSSSLSFGSCFLLRPTERDGRCTTITRRTNERRNACLKKSRTSTKIKYYDAICGVPCFVLFLCVGIWEIEFCLSTSRFFVLDFFGVEICLVTYIYIYIYTTTRCTGTCMYICMCCLPIKSMRSTERNDSNLALFIV